MIRFKRLAAGLTAAVALTAGAAHAKDIQLLSSWDRTYKPVPVFAEAFMDRVAERTGEALTVSMRGPETVPPFQQLQPVSAGVFDMLFTHGAYHLGETGMVFAMDTIVDDPEVRRESGIYELIDEHYRENHNLKLIGVFSAASGYHVMLREPLEPGEQFEDKRIRASATYHELVNALGGDAVTLPAGEIYSALERGVVDGAAWPVFGALSYGWYEVAGYMTRPTFGTNNHTLFMNLDTWNSLDEGVQQAVTEVATEIEVEGRRQFEEIWAEEEATLIERGMNPTEFTEISGDRLNALFADGVWKQVRKSSGPDADGLHEFAQANNLLQ